MHILFHNDISLEVRETFKVCNKQSTLNMYIYICCMFSDFHLWTICFGYGVCMADVRHYNVIALHLSYIVPYIQVVSSLIYRTYSFVSGGRGIWGESTISFQPFSKGCIKINHFVLSGNFSNDRKGHRINFINSNMSSGLQIN